VTANAPPEATRIDLPVVGMDCAHCAQSVQQALSAVPGVHSVEVLLGAEKAIVLVTPGFSDRSSLRVAVASAGYTSPSLAPPEDGSPLSGPGSDPAAIGRRVLGIFGLVAAVVLLVVVGGEWLGWLDPVTERIPFPVGAAFILAFGYPVFRNVVRATLRRQVISHTLMSVGVLAALAVGQWETAAIVVLFMRLGDLTERLTTDRGRRAVRDLAELAPRAALLVDDGTGQETEVPIERVRPGDVVLVRPGGLVPVDGTVVSGTASVNEAAITGESMPITATAGTAVVATALVSGGSLRVRAERIGADSVFGQVIRMVESAEADRGETQRIADRFSGWFLPVVAAIALLTFVFSRDPIATAAVLVVACSCSLALATPIAMLATIGSAAREGLLIKGGRHVETLARADVVLVDKTGTLTTGRPKVVSVIPLADLDRSGVLALAAAAERDSEHPLALAIRDAARRESVPVVAATGFRTETGRGVAAIVAGRQIRVGTPAFAAPDLDAELLDRIRDRGETAVVVSRDGQTVAVLGIADTVRPEVATAIGQLRDLGIRRIELLTGDHERAAAAIAGPLGIGFRAGLLPADKIAIVQSHQEAGDTVVMVGDGINDAPALAQANVGIAMGANGTAIAREAAHVALLRDDWLLVPEAIRSSRRAMGVVRVNLGFTAVYNVVGLSLAAFGLLPPVAAAAAQSLPDLGIMLNSARLLRRPGKAGAAPTAGTNMGAIPCGRPAQAGHRPAER
jgi:Cu+-exporting ATPase